MYIVAKRIFFIYCQLENLKPIKMKSAHLRALIMLVIAAIVLFGNTNNNKNLSASLDEFSVINPSFWIPEIKEGQKECRDNTKQNELLVPPPDKFYLQDYEKELFNFILKRKYDTEKNWCVDKRVRDTGPFSKGVYYGVHPAVRMYYSPRMMYWLTGNPDYWQEGKKSGQAKLKNPRTGEVPNGAMIVKEMYSPPADIYLELEKILQENSDKTCQQEAEAIYENLLGKLISSWTVMVKADSNSKDGWFWANPGALKPGEMDTIAAINQQLDDYSHPLYSSFGQPTCLRCHASAEENFTFSTLNNVEGRFRLNKNGVYTNCDNCPEENIINFYSDDSWRDSSYLSNNNFLSKLYAANEDCIDTTLLKQLFELPDQLLPWEEKNTLAALGIFNPHLHFTDPSLNEVNAERYPSINPAFAAAFPQILANPRVKRFPFQWSDHVVQEAHKISHYITSDNCLGCHGGLGGAPPDVTMFIKTGPAYGDGYNVSEFGEWRWSPMGLAGRDPIFFAQLESEMAILAENAREDSLNSKKKQPLPPLLHGSLKVNQEQVTSTCLSCHGAMGQRQLKLDAREKGSKLDSLFKVEYVYLTKALSAKAAKEQDSIARIYHKYGELAREGISCTVCHHINAPDPTAVKKWDPNPGQGWLPPKEKPEEKELAYMLFNNTTGQYVRGPANELNGPFTDVKIMPMKDVLGITPKHNKFITNSQMCGSCHTINLPNIGLEEDRFPVLDSAEQNPAFKSYNHTIEQATFLEWQNSSFGQFAKPGEFQSCQDCHMPGGFQSLDGNIDIAQITTKIATIQDPSYPTTENEAPFDEINVPFRQDYQRHEHVGLNVFLLEMFDQFPEILGVDKFDPMTYATNGNALAIENMIRQARNSTVDLDFEVTSLNGPQLEVEVTVKNKTGHRFPSGVSFRRSFIEFLVLEGNQVIWGSGRTNSVGVIVDENGHPLKTEFLNVKSKDTILYQPHHQVITRQDQVQIYEELNQNRDREFTTSFVHRVHPIKDNRLLPRGWRPASYFKDNNEGEVIYQFMEATDPEAVGSDPDYQGVKPPGVFRGQDKLKYKIRLPRGVDRSKLSIKVRVLNQSIPPYYLNQRFTIAPKGEATQRLYYLTSHLNLEGTAMQDWKLPLVWKEKLYCEDTGEWE